jgi:hypothetical protein
MTTHATAEPRVGDVGADQRGGATLAPPAEGGWSVPSSGGFGTGEAAAGTATAPSSAGADPAASTLVLPAASVSAAKAKAEAESEAGAVPVSSALREARQAAGIDESEFQGILASLPESGQAAVPAAAREPYKEQGVLSAEGSRIRPLGRVQLEPDAGSRSQN